VAGQGKENRIVRLKERLQRLEHDVYRTHKDLSVVPSRGSSAEAVVVRKARALALALAEMPIYILDEELIVGGRTLYGDPERRDPGMRSHIFRSLSRWPGMFYPRYLDDGDSSSDGTLGHNCVDAREGAASGHAAVGFHRVLAHGFGGLRQLARQSAERLRAEEPPDLPRRLAFLEAAEIVLRAASEFVRRYAQYAATLRDECTDTTRRQELANIAQTCERVSDRPPQTFRESLQLFAFARVVSMVESFFCMPLGRFDQYMFPFYARDIEAGRLSRSEALELLECLFVKLNEEVDVATTDDCIRIMLSGQTGEGVDATNELSYLCLEAAADLRLPTPKVGVRIHDGTPSEFLTRCAELLRLGIGGLPEFYMDKGIIATLLAAGISPEDALDYCHDGCSEITIGGRSDFYPVWTRFRFLKTLEELLAQGQDYSSFSSLLTAYKEMVATYLEKAAEDGNRRDRALGDISPAPFISATLEGCLERGLDKTWGGTIYNETGMLGMELPNTANSLAAIKRFVYDEPVLTLAELRRVLADDFGGGNSGERLRLLLLNRAPKYGNDDAYVDDIAVDIAEHYIRIVNAFENPRGGRYRPGFFDFGNFIWGARQIGATPDGRRAGEGVAGHLMVVPGTDRNGPTANVRSACKIMRLQPAMGAMLDIRLHPSAVRGPGGLDRLISFLQTYMDLGGMALQFNVVDSATLRAAQREPERYRDLLVRVWGFSAYFVELTPEFQAQIISRTEHSL
jgi:pyruvate formate-lyase/glycerol dehydratase family glycyl radical enzyme